MHVTFTQWETPLLVGFRHLAWPVTALSVGVFSARHKDKIHAALIVWWRHSGCRGVYSVKDTSRSRFGICAHLPLKTCNQSLVRVMGHGPDQLHATLDLRRTIRNINSTSKHNQVLETELIGNKDHLCKKKKKTQADCSTPCWGLCDTLNTVYSTLTAVLCGIVIINKLTYFMWKAEQN